MSRSTRNAPHPSPPSDTVHAIGPERTRGDRALPDLLDLSATTIEAFESDGLHRLRDTELLAFSHVLGRHTCRVYQHNPSGPPPEPPLGVSAEHLRAQERPLGIALVSLY